MNQTSIKNWLFGVLGKNLMLHCCWIPWTHVPPTKPGKKLLNIILVNPNYTMPNKRTCLNPKMEVWGENVLPFQIKMIFRVPVSLGCLDHMFLFQNLMKLNQKKCPAIKNIPFLRFKPFPSSLVECRQKSIRYQMLQFHWNVHNKYIHHFQLLATDLFDHPNGGHLL